MIRNQLSTIKCMGFFLLIKDLKISWTVGYSYNIVIIIDTISKSK